MIARLYDELEALYPDMQKNDGVESYTVSAANGMVAGVHILLTGLTPGLPVHCEVEGPHTAFKVFELKAVPVEVNTGARLRSAYLHDDINETLLRKAPFYIYDVLKPIYNLLLPTSVTAALALKTLVEYCRISQTHTFQIRITHAGEQQTLQFHVACYPCTVPRAGRDTHGYINWISYENVARYHGLTPFTPAYAQMLERYLRAAVFSRQNMINLPLDMCFHLQEGHPVLAHDKLDYFLQIAQKAGITHFQGGAFCARKSGVSDNDAFYNALPHETFSSPDQVADAFRQVAFDCFDNGTEACVMLTQQCLPGAAGERTLLEMASQTYAYLVQRNLLDSWTQCCLDEPNDALAPTYRLIAHIVKRAMPNIPILEPVLPTHALPDCIDIYCPTTETYENDQAYYDSLVEKGASLYVYTCLTPGGNYLNRMLDMQRIRQTYLFWAPILYPNIKGFLHWGLNQYPNGDNPYARSCVMFSEQVLEFHPKRALFLPAGDFCIFYPGDNGPLLSTRSEAHRLGLEDLCLLENMDATDAKALAARVLRGYQDYDNSIAHYRETRKLLLEKACLQA